jgi:hypothetical protein
MPNWEPHTNFTARDLFKVVPSICIECGDFISEAIPRYKEATHVRRSRCCKCLARWWAEEAADRFPGMRT